MAIVLWFAALLGLVVAATVATARGRVRPDDIAGRAVIGVAAVAFAAIVAATVWVWGGATATTARADRIADGAAVELELRGVHVPHAAFVLGHGAAATVRVPGEGPAQLATLDASDLVRPATDAIVRVVPVPRGELAASVAARTPCAGDAGGASLPIGGVVAVLECERGAPVRAFVLARAAADVVVTPLAWRGDRFVPIRRGARAGEVVILGERAALPGVAVWELAAPPRANTVLAVPSDPTACGTWIEDRGIAHATADGCTIGVGPFEIAALPLVPDPARVVARAWHATVAIGAPPFVLLVVLLLAPRRARRAHTLARALALATVAAGLAALVCDRLFWAYRIDVLRDLAGSGARVASNQLGAVAIGAALAGLAARVATTRRSIGLLAWATWLAAAGWVAGVSLVSARPGVLALSLAAMMVTDVGLVARLRRYASPELALVAIAIAAIGARVLAPRAALGKLGLAFATVLAGHAALRIAVGRETPWARRAWLVGALAATTVAIARYDAGVALAVTGTGLALAMLVAGHDAAYDASQGARIGLLEREHARLVVVHAVAAALLAIGLASAALVTSARALREHGALAVTHAPLAATALFALAALVARSNRRAWLPWLAAALAGLALWGARDRLVDRFVGGDGVGARRIAAVVEPGYALLSDERAFAATASAWREAALPATTRDIGDVDAWHGEGYFGARFRDPGVARSIDNDYLPILVARETGVAGLLARAALLLAIAIGAAVLAGARLRHASADHRARTLIAAVACVLVLYQPLAALGVLPLTGISWPGLGIDSPADLWLFVIGALWCALARETRGGVNGPACLDQPPAGGKIGPLSIDERIRSTPRVVRARQIVVAALVVAGVATTAIVARAGACALDRAATDDLRIDAALRYAASLACPWHEHTSMELDELVPTAAQLASTPTDAATTRFDRELRDHWTRARPSLVATLAACHAPPCTAELDAGLPAIRITVAGTHATCAIDRTEDAIRAPRHRAPSPRIRVVAAPLGIAARDVGELLTGAGVTRVRDASVALGNGATIAIRPSPRAAILRGNAEVFVADPAAPGAWRRMVHGPEVVLDRVALIVTDRVALFRPTADALVADDGDPLATAARRVYPYGAALPELGWVNPYDVAHSLGLDGWIHAALARPTAAAASCGTLAPPPIARERICSTSPLDGVTECRIALQPELVARLHASLVAAAPPAATREAYVLLRGDTGEILAQDNFVPGRPPLAYAPTDRVAEATLVHVREEPGEADAERIEWNLPIAAGSTLKPIIARAAEQAFPTLLARLQLSAAGHATGCRARHGKPVDPIFGHCPPTSVAGSPTTAGVHDFLAHSPNWYEAALGIVGLGLGPQATLSIAGRALALDALIARDVQGWSTAQALEIADATGPIITKRAIVIAGLRRTPMWSRVEALLGRPTCTHCARAAARADTCAARALPIADASADLRYLVALGPDRVELADGPLTEYFQLLRGSGVHPVGSLGQLTDAFGRVIYDPASDAPQLAASWFPAPAVGKTPTYTCAGSGSAPTVLGADGGLCAVVRPGGTAYAGLRDLLDDPRVALYGAKTGTIDSLADIARRPAACRAWNASHPSAAQLACGATTPDDSLVLVAFGVVTPDGTIPLTLGIQLQRAGKGAAARATPALVRTIADYLADQTKSP